MLFKILITDDEDDFYILTTVFKNLKLQHHFEQLMSGEDLLNYLFKIDFKMLPDLIILDYNMPKLNGLEVLRKIRAKVEFNKIPIIIYSTSDDNYLKQVLLANGATDYVTKNSSLKRIEEFALGIDAYLRNEKMPN